MGGTESIDRMPCNFSSVDLMIHHNLQFRKPNALISASASKWIFRRLSMISDCRFLTRARRQEMDVKSKNETDTNPESEQQSQSFTQNDSQQSPPSDSDSNEKKEFVRSVKVLGKKSRSSNEESFRTSRARALRSISLARSNHNLRGRPKGQSYKRPLQPSSITNSPPKKKRKLISKAGSSSNTSGRQYEESENCVSDSFNLSVNSHSNTLPSSTCRSFNKRKDSVSSEDLIETAVFSVSSPLTDEGVFNLAKFHEEKSSLIDEREIIVDQGLLKTKKPYYIPFHNQPAQTDTMEKILNKVQVPEWSIVPLSPRLSSPPINPQTGELLEMVDDVTYMERHLKQENEEKRSQRLERCWRKEMELREKWEEKERKRKERLGIPIHPNSSSSSNFKSSKASKTRKKSLNLGQLDIRNVTSISVKENVSVMAFGAPVVALNPGEFALTWKTTTKTK